MKIFNDEHQIIHEAELKLEALDFSNFKQDTCLIIPINDENMRKNISYGTWEHIQSEWCGSDDDKLKMQLYIDLLNDFDVTFQFIAYPNLPPEEDMKHEIETACDDCRDGVKAYYDAVKDYYKTNNNGCGLGEYGNFDIELTDQENLDLMQVIISELCFPNSKVVNA